MRRVVVRAEESRRARRGRRAALLGTALAVAALAPAGAETLQDALAAAYATNPTLEAQRASLRATDEGFRQALAGWLPSVTVSGSYTTEKTDIEPTAAGTFMRGGSEDSTAAAITGTQNVFTGFRTYYGLRQAQDTIEAGRAQLTTVEQTILFQTVAAYLDVRRDLEVVALRQNNVAVLTRQLEAAEDRFRVGEITRTDVAQAQARLELARSNLIQAEAQLTASRQAYERVVGRMPESLEPPPPLPPLPQSEEEATGIATQANPELIAARETEEASRRQVAISKGVLLPSVGLQARAALSDINNSRSLPTETQSHNDSISLQLSMPLYQGGANYSRIRQAQQLNSRDRLRIAEAQRAVEEDVANAWESLRSAQGRIVSTSEQVRANEIAFEGVQQEALVGSRTTLDVLDAEQELLDSRVSLVLARRDEYVAAFNLLSVIGRLTAQDLGLPVDLYDPRDYYRAIRFAPAGFFSLFE